MAAQKGSALLMKIGDGGSPEAFTTIGGMRSTSIALNDEMVTLEYSGEYNDSVQYSFTFESAGAITFATV